ncbi:ABC transporter substrate-binding protein [Kaistia sp. 32K]|uniref:heme/hemin ABC transporter substrate-binding protein n=1 Tax=Kaistia sp. 32K TaxID=2795690 RepID=UPI0019167D33|nr:ABC transporter substrate-binding protein [Kaistia sp. 32K]BCP55990.1 ABC transporter substrate-binding protein [Kaistia sp. 32K]
MMKLAHTSPHHGAARSLERFASRRFQIFFGLAFAVGITLSAIVQTVAAERVIDDATGRSVKIGTTDRIVTIGGDITEIVYALGAGDRVIARDTTSSYPPEANEKPDIGYMRALSAEGVLSVKPDLIIAVEGAGPKDAIDLLESASVPIVIVPERRSADSIVAKIRLIADILGKKEQGDKMADTLAARFDVLETAIGKIPANERKKAVFLMSLNGGKPMAAGHDTSADAMIQLAGGINPMASVEGYKPASDEALVAAAPEVVVMMIGQSGPPKPETVFDSPALRATPAAKNQALISMDGLYLLGFGPRTADAARDLAHALYPSLDLPAWPAAD